MPIVQLMVLGLIISGFAIFIIVLLSVSTYVSIGDKAAAPKTSVTPARRPDDGAVATAAQHPGSVRRFA